MISSGFISLKRTLELLDLLEKITRGLHSSNLPNFANVNQKKKILITGFDPFRAIYKNYILQGVQINEGFDSDYHLSNPSGCFALELDGFESSPDSNGNIAVVKSSLIPVRYREFDNRWIEDFFERYINPFHQEYQQVDMIITLSYGVESTVYDFEMERFAARYRDIDSIDNNQMKAGISNYLRNSNKDGFEFIESNLPINSLFLNNWVGLDQKASFFYSLNGQRVVPNEYKVFNYLGDNDLQASYQSFVAFPSLSSYPPPMGVIADQIQAFKGSGGNYLSNEIFYRVAFLRKKFSMYNPNIKTGHIHVGFLKNFDYDQGIFLNVDLDRDVMIAKIKEAIINSLIAL